MQDDGGGIIETVEGVFKTFRDMLLEFPCGITGSSGPPGVIPARIECAPDIYAEVRRLADLRGPQDESRNSLFDLQIVAVSTLPMHVCQLFDGYGKRISAWYRGKTHWYVVNLDELREQLRKPRLASDAQLRLLTRDEQTKTE